MNANTIETDVLVVGAGPAGAATAAFLGRYGTRTLLISRHRGTADTPRAHLTNQRTMEALRDAGLEADCIAAGSVGSHVAHTFWLRSMAGDELARAWAWGNDPARQGDYQSASPCRYMDLPQTKLEPILVTEAAKLGAQVRFGWELQSFEQDADGVTAQVLDRWTGATVQVRAKYMVGADGARSRVVEQLGLPLIGRGGLGMVYNVLCEVDLARYTVHRQGSLYNVIQPGVSAWGSVAVFRMVRPWDQWLVGMVLPHDYAGAEPTAQEFAARIQETIGDGKPDVRVLSISKWHINDIHAERLSAGRVFCMGDAVHRHPPAAALGSNTCVQDAFNLAWKLAYVLQGKAQPSLLDSFNDERQPVARQIVARANQSMGHSLRMMDLMGGGTRMQLTAADQADLVQTAAGRERVRQELAQARYNGHAHGVEMTRTYNSSAVVSDGSVAPTPTRDPDLYYEPSTRPGSVVPHAWLVRRGPGATVSTLDLAGKGVFRLFSGHGGEAWRDAAQRVAQTLGLDVAVTLIGPGLDYEDPYNDWWARRGVDDDGCVLVRPDQIVAWRCPSKPTDTHEALATALAQILGR